MVLIVSFVVIERDKARRRRGLSGRVQAWVSLAASRHQR
jgi:hypothetical protein